MNNHSSKRVMLLLLPLIYSFSASALEAMDTAGWYVEMYGSAAPTDRTKRVQKIFKKVKRASKGVALDTSLVIVKSQTTPWAIALPDGNIVISLGTLELAYRNVSTETGDARMAFVLGHEIAHQLNDDFWHQTLSGPAGVVDMVLENANDQNVRHRKEIKADAEGFINAMLAGYRVDKLIDNIGENSFLEYWVVNTGTISAKTHPRAEVRTRLLRTRMEAVQEKVEIFKYGVRLAHFGRYDDALQFLNYFHDGYRSREVLNNLGYVYLQTARQKMPAELAYRFWYRTLLEPNTGFTSRSWLSPAELPDDARQDLEIAQDYLESAIKMDRNYSRIDFVSRINLIAVYLYLQKPGSARDLVNELGRRYPGEPLVLSLRALILYQEEPDIDTWERAKLIIEPLAKDKSAAYDLIYNYSRLLTERGRAGAASAQWERLVNNLKEIPFEYQRLICLAVESNDCASLPVNTDIEYGDISTPLLTFGDDVDSRDSRALLKDWKSSKEERIGSVNARLFSNNGDTMLALDDKIELATLKKHKFRSKEHLLDLKGEPLVQYPLAGGEIWSYGNQWSAMIIGEAVQEIWLARP